MYIQPKMTETALRNLRCVKWRCRTVPSGLHFDVCPSQQPWAQPHQRQHARRLQRQSQEKNHHGQVRGYRRTTLTPRLCQEHANVWRVSPKTSVSTTRHLIPMPSLREKKSEKSLGIQRDAKDPQLLAKLNRLGPVQVHHHLLPSETVCCALRWSRFRPSLILLFSRMCRGGDVSAKKKAKSR